MAPKIYHLHPLVAGDLSDWPAHFARCRAMGFDTVCVAPPFAAGRQRRHFRHRRSRGAAPGAGLARHRRCRHRAHHARGRGAWAAHLAGSRDRSGRDRCRRSAAARSNGSPRRAAARRPARGARRVAWVSLTPGWSRPRSPRRMAEWWLDRLARLVRAGIAGFRCLDPDHAPASLWRRIIGAFEARAMPLPGVDAGRRARGIAATGRRRLRPRVFLARVVGRACELAGGGGRDVAAHRAGDGLARAVVLRTARGAAGAWAAISPPTVASRCGWPRPPGAACSCRWASNTPRAAPSMPRMAGRTDFRRARDEAPADLTADVAAANALVDHVAECRVDGEMRQLTAAQDAVTALLRSDAPDLRNASRAADGAGQSRYRPHRAGRPVGFAAAAAGRCGVGVGGGARRCGLRTDGPGEVRVLAYAPTRPVIHPVVRDEELQPIPSSPPRGSPSRQFSRRCPTARLR